MPDVVDRFEKEHRLSRAMWLAWLAWSDEPSSELLRAEKLRDRITEHVAEPLWSQYREGFRTVTSQFGVAADDRRAARVFKPYYEGWVGGVSRAWEQRVRDYEADQRQPEPSRPPWEYVRGEGRNFLKNRETGLYEPAPEIRSESDPRKVIGARPLVFPSDADREGVSIITDTNTAGELYGKREAERLGGGRIEAYWFCDMDPCPECRKLCGTPSKIWMRVAPSGPKLHFYCRCYLVYRRLFAI